jgi:predicted hotdog family 3-hydroxylacyl-ACP dehydratase
MLDRERILALIPHQGSMCQLDAVLSWDPHRIHCRSERHRAADQPLRRHGRLRCVHLCEFGAQAMALHGGLLAREQGGIARPGLLVSLRGVQLQRDFVDQLPGALDVEAELLLASAGSWQYGFRVGHAGTPLAEGRAAVMLLPA